MTAPRAVDHVTLDEARYLSLVAQRLEPMPGEPSNGRVDKDRLHRVIDQAGVVQLDSISVVSRAHETVLWSRVGRYKVEHLGALHYPERRLFEYRAHAASLLPVEFFPYVRRQMGRYRDPEATRWGKWGSENRELLLDVLRTVEEQGPVSTRAFERPAEIERRPWDWFGGKPAKEALDYLWTVGELTIQRRVGFERVYDLTSRVFPDLTSEPLPSEEEEAAFFTARALSAVGIGTVSWIADYYRMGTTRYVQAAEALSQLQSMATAGNAFPVALEHHKALAWLDPALAPALEAYRSGIVKPSSRVVLCPFDNLLWRRDRAFALFGFDYLLESYTPEPKRIYGYYTLPILIDGRLVGRLDARYRRKERVLSVKAIHLEPGVSATAVLAGQILGILRRFTAFLGGGEVEVLLTVPDRLHHHIRKRLD